MTKPHKRYKIKIKDIKSGRQWVKAYIKDGTWKFVLRGEYSATKFPEDMLHMEELVKFLGEKDFEIILLPYLSTSSVL